MANFAVNASDEVIAKGKDLLEKMARPGDKQGDVLGRIFRIVEEQKDGETMKEGGVDVQALDASLANIRTMFLVSVTGKEQVIAEKDGKIAEVKRLKDQMEADLREKMSAAKAEKEAAVAQAEAAAKAAAQAIKDAQAAKEQAETANSLVAEKDRTIAALAEKLAAAEAKAEKYDMLKAEKEASDDRVRALKADLATAAKDSEIALLRAVSDKDQEIAGLKTKVAMLQERIADLAGH